MRFLRIPDNRIYNAYLLEGEDSAVLVAAALDFARRILKDTVRVNAREHPDLIFVGHEKPGVISVDDVRRQLGDTVEIRPYEAQYKLYIVEEAEKLNVQAQNALLKTLEEPPEYAVIMLLTKNANVFLETILSRVVEFKAGEADAGEQFAAIAEQPWVKETLRMLGEARYLTASDILAYIKQLHAEEIDFQEVLSLAELIVRDALSYKCTGDAGRIYAKAASGSIISIARDLDFAALGRASDGIEEALRQLRFHVNEDLVLENLFITLQEGEAHGAPEI